MIETGKKRSTTGKNDSLVDNIRRQLRRCRLQGHFHRFDDRARRFRQRLGDVPLRDCDFFWYPVEQVTALDFQGDAVSVGRGSSLADLLLDSLGARLADQ